MMTDTSSTSTISRVSKDVQIQQKRRKHKQFPKSNGVKLTDNPKNVHAFNPLERKIPQRVISDILDL